MKENSILLVSYILTISLIESLAFVQIYPIEDWLTSFGYSFNLATFGLGGFLIWYYPRFKHFIIHFIWKALGHMLLSVLIEQESRFAKALGHDGSKLWKIITLIYGLPDIIFFGIWLARQRLAPKLIQGRNNYQPITS